jgi:hypothetical protein
MTLQCEFHGWGKLGCPDCRKEREQQSDYGIKAGWNEKLSELPVIKTFKTKKAAENYCAKMNAQNDGKPIHYTWVFVPKAS